MQRKRYTGHWSPKVWPVGRLFEGTVWHAAPPNRPFIVVPAIATTDGRCHRRGGAGAWYGCDVAAAIPREVERHFLSDGVDPANIVRQIGTVHAHLVVLDLTDQRNCSMLGVRVEDLTAEDWTYCQRLADITRDRDYNGIVLPSGALPGAKTIVVFSTGMIGLEVSWVTVTTVEAFTLSLSGQDVMPDVASTDMSAQFARGFAPPR